VDEKRFWDIIDSCCRPDASPDEWEDALHEALVNLPPSEILHFDWLFQAKTAAAYSRDLWGAAYLINGGASDDGFYYFRCWLVGRGKRVYESALANPDSLSDILPQEEDAEAEIYAVARYAWFEATNQPDTTRIDYGSLGPPPKLRLAGKKWDFDDDAAVRKRFPRLAAIYLDGEGE
jgi:hypothetical protein